MLHLLADESVGTGLAEGSTLRTRASDAGWLNGNISKRAVDLVPCLRFAPLRSQISSSFGTSATPPFPLDSFFENMRHRCIQNSLLPVPIEYILAQRTLRPAEAVLRISSSLRAASPGGFLEDVRRASGTRHILRVSCRMGSHVTGLARLASAVRSSEAATHRRVVFTGGPF